MENKEQYIYKDGRYIKLSSFDHGANIEIVNALPEIGNENTIYLLKEQEESGTNEDNNLYLQYIYKDGKYRLAGGGGSTAAVKITYSELKALRDNSKLIPGQQYRIIDYITTTAQENTQSAGHQFDVIVTADDERTLNENARAAIHEGDEYFQKITSDTKLVSANWKEGVTLNSIIEEYKMSDDHEKYLTPIAKNKEFTEMLTITNKDGVKVPCLLNPDPYGEGQDDYLVYCGTYEWTKTTNTLLTIYYTITDDKSQEYKGQCPSHADDIFVEIAYKDINGVSTPVLYKEDLGFYLSDNSSVDYGDEFRYLDNYVVDGVTYNRWLKYEDPTSSYYQILTNIIVVNNQFTVSPEEFKMAVQEIPVIYDKWQQCDSNGETRPGPVYYMLTNNLVNAKWAVLNTSVKTLANLAAWEIKYCLDNDTNRFTWALDGQAIINLNSFGSNGKPLTRQQRFDGSNFGGVYSEYKYAWGTLEDVDNGDNTNFIYSKNATLITGETVYNSNEGKLQNAEVVEGKGIIYYMKDEWNNEAPYDFKNIQFKRYKITECQKSPSLVGEYLGVENGQSYTIDTADFIWCYTFTWINETNVSEDCSIVGQTLSDDTGQYLGMYNNKLAEAYKEGNESFGFALNNTVIQDTYSNDSGLFYGMYDNTFGSNCYNNTFASECLNNYFGNNCYNNIFRHDCSSNTFGNGCDRNIFGWQCRDNIFGNACSGNTFGNRCSSNIFSNNCYRNTFGDDCDNNTFGNDCESNTFGNDCSGNTFSNNCYHNTLGENYINFNELKTGVSYINLTSTSPAAATNNNWLKNIIINPGVKGKDPNNHRTITVERNLPYSTTILAPGSKEIILDEE